MKECKLDQKQLAVVLGVPLHRVKSLSSGRVQKLTREESEVLVTKLKINPEWLITGEGPMVEEETQEEFVSRMQAINHMNAVVAALPLNEIGRDRLQALMTGDPAEDGRLIGDALMNRDAIERPQAGFTQTQYQQSSTVTPLPLNESDLLTQQQILEIVLDAMHLAGKTLPAKAVNALVETGMRLQREGVPVNKSALETQLRAVK